MLRSFGTLIAGLLLYVLGCTARMLGWIEGPVQAATIDVFGNSFTIPLLYQLVAGALLVIADLLLLYHIANEYALFSIRTYLHLGLFLVFMVGASFTTVFTAGNICLTLTLLLMIIILTTYQQPYATSEYVLAFMLFALCTMLVPKWTYLFPILLISCRKMGSLNLRTFLAALLGFIAPYWIAAGTLFLVDEIGLFLIPFDELIHLTPINYSSIPFEVLEAVLFVTLLTIPALLYYPTTSSRMKERTRATYSVLIFFFLGALLLAYLQPQQAGTLFPLLAAMGCLLVTQMLVSLCNRHGITYQIVVVILLLLYLTRPLWMPLSNS